MELSYFAGKLNKPQAGRGYLLACCVFHEDHNPSMILYERIGKFECFSCGVRGSLEYLASKLGGHALGSNNERPNKRRATQRPLWLDVEISTYCREAQKRLSQIGSASSYLDRRGLGTSIQWAQLGWDRGWFIVPIQGSDRTIQGAVARASPDRQNQSGMKFDMPYGQKPMLYVPNWNLWGTNDRVFVVFGVFDAISLAVAGYASASPSSGKLSLETKWLDDVSKPIYIIPDRGEEEQAFEYARKLDWRGRVATMEYDYHEKDINDILVYRGAEGLRNAVESKQRDSVRIRSSG